MSLDKGAFGERLELVLIDGNTGKVKRHLVVAEGLCIDLTKDINWEVEKILLEGRLREVNRLKERIMLGVGK